MRLKHTKRLLRAYVNYLSVYRKLDLHFSNQLCLLLLSIFLLSFQSITLSAQVVLQLEKRSKIRATKFYPGDELSIKLHGEKNWRTGYFMNGDLNTDNLYFSFGEVNKNEIRLLRTIEQRDGARQASKMLLYFGAGVMLYTPVELIYQEDPNWPFIAVGAASFITGILLPKLLQPFLKSKIGKRNRLRLIDLTPPSPLDYPDIN